MDKSLKLSEKLFFLAVNPAKGGILLNASSTLGMALSGAVLVELSKMKLISIENSKIQLLNPMIQSNGIYEFFLYQIRRRRKEKSIKWWISVFNMKNRKIQKLFIRELVQKHVLRTEEKRILFIPYEKVYLMDRELVESVSKDVAKAALGIGDLEEENLILALLAAKTNLLPRIFPERTKRKEAARHLKNVPETEVSKAVKEAIQMMHAAVFIAAST